MFKFYSFGKSSIIEEKNTIFLKSVYFFSKMNEEHISITVLN